MIPGDDFDLSAFLDALPALSKAERFDGLVTYLNSVFQSLTTPCLREIRVRLEMLDATPEQEVVLGTLDGLIALREMNESKN